MVFTDKITLYQEFIARFIQHIPDVGFRMVRYYGFLANRVRGEMLPKVRLLLGETDPNTPQVNYRTLMQNNFNIDPYESENYPKFKSAK